MFVSYGSLIKIKWATPKLTSLVPPGAPPCVNVIPVFRDTSAFSNFHVTTLWLKELDFMVRPHIALSSDHTQTLEDSTSHFIFARLLNGPLGWNSSMYLSISKPHPSPACSVPRRLTCKGCLKRLHSPLASSWVQPPGSTAGEGGQEHLMSGYLLTQLPPLVLMPSASTEVREPSLNSSLQGSHPHPLLALSLLRVVTALLYHPQSPNPNPVVSLHLAHPL